MLKAPLKLPQVNQGPSPDLCTRQEPLRSLHHSLPPSESPSWRSSSAQSREALPPSLVDFDLYDQWMKKWAPRKNKSPTKDKSSAHVNGSNTIGGIHTTILHYRASFSKKTTSNRDIQEKPFYGDTVKSKKKTKKVKNRLYLGSATKTFLGNEKPTPPKSKEKIDWKKTLKAPLPLHINCLGHERNRAWSLPGDQDIYRSTSSLTYRSKTESPLHLRSMENLRLESPLDDIKSLNHSQYREYSTSPSPELFRLAAVHRKGTLLQGRVHAFTVNRSSASKADDLVITNTKKGQRVVKDATLKPIQAQAGSRLEMDKHLQLESPMSMTTVRDLNEDWEEFSPGWDNLHICDDEDLTSSHDRTLSASIASEAAHQEDHGREYVGERNRCSEGQQYLRENELQILEVHSNPLPLSGYDLQQMYMKCNYFPMDTPPMEVIYEESTINDDSTVKSDV